MINIDIKSKCSGCHACYNSCPKRCISMYEDDEGFLYPSIDNDQCINCGLCERVCPFLDTEKRNEPKEAWAAKCTDKKLLFDSSSGGVFSLLSQRVIEDGGIVFGAAFSSDFREVHHIQANDVNDLESLRTSKYVQSVIGNSFQIVKKLLEDGKTVLFSGTPCQIAGLKNYLQIDYENLFCVDVICHGVPSPDLWRRYLDDIKQKHLGGKITRVNFRHKKTSWQKFGICKTIDGVDIFTSKDSDPYMQMFLRNFSLRPSCYSCQQKINGSSADISLGDFWGIESVAPEMNDGKGTSAVIVHTEKGRQLFNKISNDTYRQCVSYEHIKKYNSPIYKSVDKPEKREEFFKDVEKLSFDELKKKYCPSPHKSLKQIITSTKLFTKVRLIIRGGGKC